MSDSPAASPSRLERAFRRASYLTLLLACLSLAWAEWDIVPDARVVTFLVLPVLAAAFLLEGRWSLTTSQANAVGIGIAGAIVIRAIVLTFAPAVDGILATMAWPASLVPLFGPLLMLLVAVKLLRPKTVADHWGLQGMGLGCVGVACAFAPEDIFFALILTAYLLSALWCLGLFFLYRERLSARVAENAHTPRWRQLLAWAVPVVALAMLGFFTLPRSNAVWQVPRQSKRLDTGTSEESGLDLNRTGTLKLDPEVAFEVFVENAQGNGHGGIPSDQYWRGQIYRYYYNGGWRRSQTGVGIVARASSPLESGLRRPTRLPDLGPDQLTFTFTPKTRLGNVPLLADPVFRPIDGTTTVAGIAPSGEITLWTLDADNIARAGAALVPGRGRYRQVTLPAPERGLGHEVTLPGNLQLLTQPPEWTGLTEWTERLLRQLADSGRLPRPAVEQRDLLGRVHPRHHETIARALEHHLASSGEYTYSLDLTRTEPDHPNFQPDPTLDFLLNTKSGHCNRFASALAVMLRALTIPCQVVNGYRGADATAAEGVYEVRQCYAHTWVEVLVTRRQPDPAHGMFAGNESWHWLTLDPTPSEAGMQATEVATRWFGLDLNPRRLYRELILNFSAENRDSFIQSLSQAAGIAFAALKRRLLQRTPEGFRARVAALLILLTLSAAFALLARGTVRRLRRWTRGAAHHPGTAFHRRLLAILARKGWRPTPAQTPREFALTVADLLHAGPPGAPMANVVTETTDLYYRARFGDRPLSPTELAEVNRRLDRLAAALAGGN